MPKPVGVEIIEAKKTRDGNTVLTVSYVQSKLVTMDVILPAMAIDEKDPATYVSRALATLKAQLVGQVEDERDDTLKGLVL